MCPREGSWGVGPPVWMCPCKSGCGRTHKGASVDVSEHTCGMCVAHVPWPLSQPPRSSRLKHMDAPRPHSLRSSHGTGSPAAPAEPSGAELSCA